MGKGARFDLSKLPESARKQVEAQLSNQSRKAAPSAYSEASGATTPRSKAKIRQDVQASGMNKSETRYAEILECRLKRGEIHRWDFEPIRLKLGPDNKTTYTPDFMVIGNDGFIELIDVKGGFIMEDAMLKLKLAAKLFPMFTFRMAQYRNGEWTETELKAF